MTLRALVAGLLVSFASAAQAAPDASAGVWPMLLSLVLILGGFIAVAWLARRYLPGVGKQGVVKVVGATMVGPRERVVVVEVDDTWLLLGVGAGQVRLLDKRAKPGNVMREESL